MIERCAVGCGEIAEGADFFLLGSYFGGLQKALGAGGARAFRDAAEIFGSEQALGQWAEADAADAFFLEVIEDAFCFNIAVENRVGRLVNEAACAHFLKNFHGFLEALERVFGEADVECLATLHGGVEGGHGFLQAGVGIGAVRVEDIDVIEAEALERLIERGEEVLARAIFAIGTVPHIVAGFGGDDQFIAVAGEVFDEDAADIFLGRAGRWAVVIGVIEMGDATVEGTVHDAAGFFKVIDVAEVMPESEGNCGKEDAGVATTAVRHAAIVAG